MNNPYLIDGPALISFSGGRTSAYMLWHILDAYNGKLPDNIHVTFANTGKEREETLRFVHDCASHWGLNVVWLEREGKKGVRQVGFNSAARNGEPFSDLLHDKRYLPNAVTRFCTIELKIRVMKHWMMEQGYTHWSNVIGLRYDEPNRVEKAMRPNKERWSNILPLHHAQVTNRMVRAFWADQPFDLQLLPFEGNCDACFLKARPKLWEIERTRPGTLQWWAEAEAELANLVGKSSGTRFRKEYSYEELIRDVRNQPDMFAGGLFDFDPDMDAECGTWCAEAS